MVHDTAFMHPTSFLQYVRYSGAPQIVGFGFFSKLEAITLSSDEVVLSKATSHPIANFLAEQLLSFEDIVLSQSGNSSGKIKTSNSDILKFKKVKIGKSNWELGELTFELDIFKPSLTATAGFGIPKIFKGEDGGIGVTLGFLLKPLALETIGGNISKEGGFITLPTTPPSPAGVSLNSGSLQIDNISSGRPLQMTGKVGMSLTDMAHSLPALEELIRYQILSGEVALMVDFSGKVDLSGNVSLLEKFELGNALLSLSPSNTSVEGNINVIDVLIGRLYLAISVLSNYVEITGQQQLTIQLPSNTPIVGQKVLSNQDTQATLRFNSEKMDLAEFTTKFKFGNMADVGVRVDITDIKDPHVYITNFGKTIKVRSGSRLRAGERQVITIDKDYDTVMLVATSDQNAALFNLIPIPTINILKKPNPVKSIA